MIYFVEPEAAQGDAPGISFVKMKNLFLFSKCGPVLVVGQDNNDERDLVLLKYVS